MLQDNNENDLLNNYREFLHKKSELFTKASHLPISAETEEAHLPDLDQWRDKGE